MANDIEIDFSNIPDVEIDFAGIPDFEEEKPGLIEKVTQTFFPATLEAGKRVVSEAAEGATIRQTKLAEIDSIRTEAADAGRELFKDEERKIFTLGMQAATATPTLKAPGLAEPLEDILGSLERIVGAVKVGGFQTPEGKSKLQAFIDELGDREASLFKGTKQDLRESDAPLALKVLGEIGLGVVSDPLSVIGGIRSLLRIPKVLARTSKGSLKKASAEGLDVSTDIVEDVAKIAPEGAVQKGKVTGLEITPGERALVTGKKDPALLAREAKAREAFPGKVEALQAERAGFLSQKVQKASDDAGLTGLLNASDEITGEIATNFEKAFNRVKKQTSAEFTAISKATSKAKVGADDLSEANKALNNFELGGRKVVPQKSIARSADQLTKDEVFSLIQKNEFNPAGLYDIRGNPVVKGAAGKITRDNKLLNISEAVSEKIDDLTSLLSRKDISFDDLRALRSQLREAIPRRGNDVFTISELRKQYTELMKSHLRRVGGDDLVERFVKNDALFSTDASVMKQLSRSFYRESFDQATKKTTLKLREPQDILARMTKGGTAGRKIEQLQSVLPDDAFKQLQNAYFNKIIEESLEGGLLNSKKLLRAVEKRRADSTVWNKIFSQENKNALADLLQDAVIIEKLKAFKTPAAQATFLARLKKSSDPVVRWMMFHRSPAKFLAVQAGKTIGDVALRRFKQRRAVDFFREVEPSSLLTPLKVSGSLLAPTVGLQSVRTGLRERPE